MIILASSLPQLPVISSCHIWVFLCSLTSRFCLTLCWGCRWDHGEDSEMFDGTDFSHSFSFISDHHDFLPRPNTPFLLFWFSLTAQLALSEITAVGGWDSSVLPASSHSLVATSVSVPAFPSTAGPGIVSLFSWKLKVWTYKEKPDGGRGSHPHSICMVNKRQSRTWINNIFKGQD